MNELTASDSSKTLVRIWDRSYNLRGQQFVHWHNGFTINATDPMAVELWNNREMLHQVTVESTSELAWYIDRLDRTSDELLVVTCQPHLDVLRKTLTTDAYLVDLWLDAEKRWKAAQSDTLRDQIAAALQSADRRLALEDEMPIGLYYAHLADAVIAALELTDTVRLLRAAQIWIADAISEDETGEPWLMTRLMLNNLVSRVDALGGCID